jgi:F0F1-type ATP synthase membrane subunit b/b'
MSTQDPGSAQQSAALTSLPRIEDVPFTDHGYDPDRVRDAFDAFRRHTAQLQAQLRVMQAAGRSATLEPSGHAVRMDALHLIRAAAEFADALERDAQNASSGTLQRIEEEIRTRQEEAAAREAEVERYRQESERQRQEVLNAARNEARELLANAQRDASAELREAEARGNRLLEQARHQATELTNAARAEVEGTLEWARAQANSIMVRAQEGAGQLLAAAGLGADAMERVASSIVKAAQDTSDAARTPGGVTRRPATEAFAMGPPTARPSVPAPQAAAPAAVPAAQPAPVAEPEPESVPEAPEAEETPAAQPPAWSPRPTAERTEDESDGDEPSAG